MNSVEQRNYVEYQKSKGKNVDELWEKLSNMSINTRLVSEKKKRIITSQVSSILRQCSLKCGVVLFLRVIIFKSPSMILIS